MGVEVDRGGDLGLNWINNLEKRRNIGNAQTQKIENHLKLGVTGDGISRKGEGDFISHIKSTHQDEVRSDLG